MIDRHNKFREKAIQGAGLSAIAGEEVVLHEFIEDDLKKLLAGKTSEEILEFTLKPESRRAGIGIVTRESDGGIEYVLTSRMARKAENANKNEERADKVLSRMVEILPAFSEKAEVIKKEINKGCVGCKLNSVLAKAGASFVAMCEENGVDPDLNSFDFSPHDYHALEQVKRAQARTLRLQNRAPSVGGPRPSCADCFRKHIGKAVVQLEESELGYPQHFWLAMANLSEAEAESLTEWPQLAREVREVRLDMTEDRNYRPDLMQFFDRVDELTGEIEKE